MKPEGAAREDTGVASLERGVRLDLVLAMCALLVSSLAMAAAWWQTRASLQQTQIIEEQLGAQVWPYVGISEGIDARTVRISIENDGLGPAVLRSVVATVDGKPKGGIIEILHALLGPNIVARARGFHDDKVGLTISGSTPGSVLRPGESTTAYSFTSAHFARTFLRESRRLDIRLCYCAIIPGRCWSSDTSSTADPAPQSSCPEIRHDLLHEDGIDELGITF